MNPDLIQRIDSAPDTILTLIDGTKYIVAESMHEVIARIHEHRSQLLARAHEIQLQPRMGLVPDLPADADDGDENDGTNDTHDGLAVNGSLAPPVPLRPRSS